MAPASARRGRIFAIGTVFFAAIAACSPPKSDVAVGRAAYLENCSSCHGQTAKGDGTMAVFVSTGVPNLRELAARNDGDFPKAFVIGVVTQISDMHGDIVAMPDFGKLMQAKPVVYTAPDGEKIQTNATIVAIVDYLESVQD